jgi:NTE family protein
MKTRKTLGLALGSGGVRGLSHIGVIKSLLKHNIPIDYLAGSSIGSWIGACYGLYQDFEKLEEMTVGKRKEKFFSFLEPALGGGVIRGEKLEKMLNGWLDNSDFDDLKIPFKVVATDLITGRQVVFDKGNLAAAVRASITVPGFFKPVVIKKMILVDGGISNPVPDDVVKAMGADVVVAVNLDYKGDFDFNQKKLDFTSVTRRTIEVMKQNLAEYSLSEADIVIKPSLREQASWTKYFLNGNGQEIVKIGEQEMDKAIPELKKLLG